MELRHLEYFVAVAEELSFTRASRRLRVVQSGVSTVIRALERELGAPLFDRSTRDVALTDAGRALLREARATLDAAQAARDAVQEVVAGIRGTINLGTMTGLPLVDLPGLLGRYHLEHPEVTIRLRAATSGTSGLAKSLVDGELDVAFLALADSPPAGLAARELVVVPMVLLVRGDHPLAGRERVRLTDLAHLDFVDTPPGWGNRVIVDRAFAAAGVERRVTVEVANLGAVPDYVHQGLGVALVPDWDLSCADDVHPIALSGVDLRWTLSLATSGTRRPSAALRALLAMVDQYVRASP
ncbi:LysR family transcriptional regulator [Umezawaea sp. Da 62-37]|uniref:LysR family transcriptional regulator n=1 Tax=Umezawaea sp. Da 62-37 TaxID=3075927 RepID=UPI0028F6E177|nr:LysR family transcriptional regulator [Umezawaea sp. Da 62-37]WNV89094.1 LysR family transcriptional regulator [Umezawaea sp. Da 62-37]